MADFTIYIEGGIIIEPGIAINNTVVPSNTNYFVTEPASGSNFFVSESGQNFIEEST